MMFIRRRVCGYIGDANTGAAQARMVDYKARVEHTDVPMNEIKQEVAKESLIKPLSDIPNISVYSVA